MFWIDYWYIVLVLPAMILAFWAQHRVQSTFNKYSRMPTRARTTGAEAARMVLRENGVGNVDIRETQGNLTDHFDPRNNTIYLSTAVYAGTSAAAVGVAAHEAGHAVQYAQAYAPMRLRAAIIPATQLGSNLALPLVLLGLFLAIPPLAYAGVIAFAASTVFQLVTLPVEFNASRRAMAAINSSGYFGTEEENSARSVLTAAALTYVAALAVSLANLLRLFFIVSGRQNRR